MRISRIKKNLEQHPQTTSVKILNIEKHTSTRTILCQLDNKFFTLNLSISEIEALLIGSLPDV